MRITLVHNPKAGRRAMTEAQLKKLLREAGHDVRYQSAKEDGWKKTLEKDTDLVVVAGGDGTVGRVVRRMPGRGVPVALLPSGTANNIARTLGQLERPFEELVRGWEDARRLKLDVGVVNAPWGKRNFVEGVGAGLFAEALTNPAPAKAKGKGAVETGLRRLQDIAAHAEPVEIVARLDGEDISGQYLMFEALNLRYIGSNLHLAPESTPGDGQFDVVLVTEAERSRLMYYLEHWLENRERLAVLPTRRGRLLEIEWTGFPLHIDDKLRPKKSAKPREMAGMVEARIGRAAVEFLVPPNR